MNKKTNNSKRGFLCTNCGNSGHEYKFCPEPVTSLGIILIKFDDRKLNDIFENIELKISDCGIRADSEEDIKLYCSLQDTIKFLMIKRKHTLGFSEFMRGSYKTDNFDGISYLFQQMTQKEITNIKNMSFDELLLEYRGTKENHYHDDIYNASREKFNILKHNISDLGLSFYVNHIKSHWSQPEWGFPKGRRNRNETDIECARREFEEESGFVRNDYMVLDKIDPLVEDLVGTNGVKYKHIYYIGMAMNNKNPAVDSDNQKNEIGDINYLSFGDALKLIRPYHISRKALLTKLYNFINNKILCDVDSKIM